MPIEPPFDNHPCPMCPGEMRNFSAVVHNFIGQWNMGLPHEERTRRKFVYVLEATPQVFALLTPDTHPALRALHAAAEKLIARFELEGLSMALQPAVNELRAAYTPVKELSAIHFADPLHSHGTMILG